MAVKMNFKKGLSGTKWAELVNGLAVGVTVAGTVLELTNTAAYTSTLGVGYFVGVLTLLVAAGVAYRFSKEGGEGIDVPFWVTLLVGVTAVGSGFSSFWARALLANRTSAEIIGLGIGLGIAFLLAIGCFIWFLWAVSPGKAWRWNKPGYWGSIVLFLLFSIGIGIVIIIFAADFGDVTVPKTAAGSVVALVFTLLGLIFWQDAELINLLGWNTQWGTRFAVLQKIKSALQSLGALAWLLSLSLPAGDTATALFWAGTGLAGLGIIIGFISGFIKDKAKAAVQRAAAARELTAEFEVMGL